MTKKLFFFFCFLLLALPFAYADNTETPIGYWKTIDDITGKPESILQIFENKDHTVAGKVIKNLSIEKAKYKICSSCTGFRRNQLILGMVILWGFKFDGEEWRQGRILDPTTGKIYRCKMKVVGNGNKLRVRGYIGIPLLGRTQTWLRMAT